MRQRHPGRLVHDDLLCLFGQGPHHLRVGRVAQAELQDRKLTQNAQLAEGLEQIRVGQAARDEAQRLAAVGRIVDAVQPQVPGRGQRAGEPVGVIVVNKDGVKVEPIRGMAASVIEAVAEGVAKIVEKRREKKDDS